MAYNKEEYEFYKNQDPKNLTQEELDELHETERLEAKYPSKEDLEWARFIVNEKDPYYQKLNKENGDLDKATKIMQQESTAREVMQQKGQDLYVKKVKSTPEEVVKNVGYKYNWRNSYENVKGEKLRPTEADAKKLQDYINSNMYDIGDDINLKQIAYNLHMFNPNTMEWKDFINSEQGEEFKKYLEDVRKAQTDKEVDKIWSGEEPSESYYPGLGTANVPLSFQALNFMAPVSKEYARNHYNDEDFSLTGPLATDAAANLVMAGPSWITKSMPAIVATKAGEVLDRPLVSWLYGNVAAPAITESGNVIFNDESIPEAFVRTGEGTAINVGTPRILEGVLSSIGRGMPKGNSRSVQKMIDESTNRAVKIHNDIDKGKPYPLNAYTNKNDAPIEYGMVTPEGTKYYSTNPTESNKNWGSKRKFESVKDMPSEATTREEMHQMHEGIPFARGNDYDLYARRLKDIQDENVMNTQDALILKKAKALSKDGDLRSLTPSELRQLGFSDKESYMNWLIRTFKKYTPETIQTYLTNAAGRPEFGRQAGPIENINRILGTTLFKKDKTDEEKQKSRIERILGMY